LRSTRRKSRQSVERSLTDQAQPDVCQLVVALETSALDPGRGREFLYQELHTIVPVSGDKVKTTYEWEIEFSEII
jgi:hypothetical protein